jgi:HlyD family secretion protein
LSRALTSTLLCGFLLVLGGCGAGPDPSRITLSGTVDAHEVDLAFQVAGRIDALRVDEGDAISPGQVVATLDATDYALGLAGAEAEARAANRALSALEAGTRAQELRVAEAGVERARAERQLATDELRRVAKLVPGRLASEEELQRKQVQLEVARTRLQEAEQTLQLLREGPRKEDIERAAAELAARESAVASARARLGYTSLASPVEGVISVRLAERGEVVAPGQPVLRLAELTRPWVRAYLNEQELARVRLGQPAEVRVDGVASPLRGRLGFISPQAEFTPKTVETRALRVDLVYRIKVEVDNAEGRLKVGMPADVTLELAGDDG